jgi:MFS family permease
VAVLVTSIGTGAWYTCWALFLTGFAGLSPAQVGAGITLAAGLGVIAGPMLGRLADRVGPKLVMLPLVLLQAVAFAAYVFVHDVWSFLAVAAATVGADRGSYGVRAALTFSFAGSTDRLMALSAVRVRNSTGFTIGAAVGALAIAAGTRAGYLAVALLNSASFIAYAVIVAGTDSTASVPSEVDAEADPLDGPARRHPLAYATLAAVMGVLSLCWAMLSTALPLWVARRTGAPHWISGLVVILNAGVIAGLQPTFARRITTPLGAAQGAILAGLALAASCPIFALSYHRAGATAIAIVLAGACVHVIGELLFVASGWGLSVLLMPAGAAGRYQGVFSTGYVTGMMVGPVVMTTLVLGLGQAGWIALGVLFLIAVAPTTHITRRALAPPHRRARACLGQGTS